MHRARSGLHRYRRPRWATLLATLLVLVALSWLGAALAMTAVVVMLVWDGSAWHIPLVFKP